MNAQKQCATSLIWLTCEHHLEHTRLMLNTDFVLTPAGQRAIILELISSRKKTKEISDSVFYFISFDRRRSFFGADFRRCWRRTILCHIFRARCCVIRNDCTIYQTGHGKCDSGNEIATTREREKKMLIRISNTWNAVSEHYEALTALGMRFDERQPNDMHKRMN